jgi:hypothetical protein
VTNTKCYYGVGDESAPADCCYTESEIALSIATVRGALTRSTDARMNGRTMRSDGYYYRSNRAMYVVKLWLQLDELVVRMLSRRRTQNATPVELAAIVTRYTSLLL